MTDIVRAARRAAFAFILSAAIAAPAYGADSGVAAAAATGAAISPGVESLEDVVERAIAAPAADEMFANRGSISTIPAPVTGPSAPSVERNRRSPLWSPIIRHRPRDERHGALPGDHVIERRALAGRSPSLMSSIAPLRPLRPTLCG